MASSAAAVSRRLEKEYSVLTEDPPEGVALLSPVPFDPTCRTWTVQLSGAPGSIYEGEVFTLQISFVGKYPFESPEVLFSGRSPEHPHIYENGHICLSILSRDWSPALTTPTVCNSILSMMSSCKVKCRPEDNDAYMRRWRVTKHSPKKTNWVFHDDSV
eukprot:m.130673 g.130673  ORF g.130673 m.130673 type:complete len:159 (+) comp16798_c1_seq4:129-605(+)